MQFGPISLEDAVGTILGHNIVDQSGRRLLRKGRALTQVDLDQLRNLGRREVYAARLEDGDINENDAAQRITLAAIEEGSVRFSRPATGRVNVYATALAVVDVEAQKLFELNSLAGITIATLLTNSVVHPGQMVATTKILPYAVASSVVEQAESLMQDQRVLSLSTIERQTVGLLVCGSPGSRDGLLPGFEAALRHRIETLGSELSDVRFEELPPEGGDRKLAEALARFVSETSPDLLLVAGETAIQDRNDLIPRAVEQAGGEVSCFGAPVDPGNLLMLGHIGETALLGTPGCARSPKRNIVDLVLPLLLLKRMPSQEDILHMGHGGLLEDVPERPLPRSRLE